MARDVIAPRRGSGPCALHEPAEVELATIMAALLLANGQTTEGVLLTVNRLASAFGMPLEVLTGWDRLVIVRDGTPLRIVSTGRPVSVDIRRVAAIEGIVDRTCCGDLRVAEALREVDAVRRLPPMPLVRFAVMAGMGAAALAVISGARDVPTLCLVLFAGTLGACVRRSLASMGDNPFLQPFAAALVAGLLAGAATAIGLPVQPGLAAACPCMILVPGPHFLNGTIDLTRARIPLGTARIAFATLIVLAASAGLLIGLSLSGARLSAPPATSVPFAIDIAAAGAAIAAYGTFFDMPCRMLPIPVAIGTLAHAARWLLLSRGASVEAGALTACLVVGLSMTPLARRFRLPFGATAFAAVVSMLPGIFMFQAAAGAMALTENVGDRGAAVMQVVLRDAATACLVVVAITVGLIVPKMVIDRIREIAERRSPHG